jgi:hypothetical protein
LCKTIFFTELMKRCVTEIPAFFLSLHCDMFPEEESGEDCIAAPGW